MQVLRPKKRAQDDGLLVRWDKSADITIFDIDFGDPFIGM